MDKGSRKINIRPAVLAREGGRQTPRPAANPTAQVIACNSDESRQRTAAPQLQSRESTVMDKGSGKINSTESLAEYLLGRAVDSLRPQGQQQT